jgi:glycosidase
MKKMFVFIYLFFSIQSFAIDFYAVYPTNWWVGMKNNKLQLVLHGDKIGLFEKVSIKYPGVTVVKITKTESKNYLIADLIISPQTKPGRFKIILSGGGLADEDVNYELKPHSKENGTARIKGVTSKDAVYLLMPDRFANGDPSNDAFDDMRDTGSDRNNKFARHGGDLKGIEDHLDYFNELGITAIWCTPLVDNDMPKMREVDFDLAGFHGYWFTDHYKIDKRYGGNDAYKSMINAAHKKGLKVIHDAVYNHIGEYHWMNLDPPSKDWINQWPEFTPPSHRDAAVFDPYVSKYENANMLKGWFVRHLPDMNLANPFVATYLIQNAIWLAEEFGFDGYRVDTYKYCDEKFLNNVNAALLKEFPTITTFVEAWGNDVIANAYFVQNNLNTVFKHNAMGALDFPLCFAMHAGMNQPAGWTEGVNKLYLTLAEDFAYKNPLNNCIFLDNHDLNRVYSVAGEDWNKLKWALNWLFTMRGIPQLYYGTEILMKNFKNPSDAEVRNDFPGGWAGDTANKFITTGRTDQENEAFNYTSKLLQFRKNSSALTTGKTMQYIVRNGVYIYFRYDAKQTIMVITNTGDKDFTPDWNIYTERVSGFSKMKNIISGETKTLKGFSIKSKESFVFELMK